MRKGDRKGPKTGKYFFLLANFLLLKTFNKNSQTFLRQMAVEATFVPGTLTTNTHCQTNCFIGTIMVHNDIANGSSTNSDSDSARKLVRELISIFRLSLPPYCSVIKRGDFIPKNIWMELTWIITFVCFLLRKNWFPINSISSSLKK